MTRSDNIWQNLNVVYRVYDVEGSLLYVGCTKRLRGRWAEHKGNRSQTASPWFSQVARVVVRIFPSSDSAHVAEAQAIESEHPLYNKYRGRRLWLLTEPAA